MMYQLVENHDEAKVSSITMTTILHLLEETTESLQEIQVGISIETWYTE